jgi:probable F420-dependent oxidoreductase
MVAAAVSADKLGFATMSFAEHLLVRHGDPLESLNRLWYDTGILASHVAAHTSRIRLLFNACVLPYHPPINHAKALATLDVVSHGRVTVIAGAGWLESEFDALGIPFSERGERTDEHLRVMKALWAASKASPASYQGQWTSFSEVSFEPQCVQVPHVPIWVGGSGPRPLRRAAELGDGWAPMIGSLDQISQDFARVKDMAAAYGRDPANLALSYGATLGEADPSIVGAIEHVEQLEASSGMGTQSGAQHTLDVLGQYAAAGVTHVPGTFAWTSPQDYHDRLQWLAEEVLPHLPLVNVQR